MAAMQHQPVAMDDMAGLIPQGFIDDLLNRTDLVEVVGERIQLKKAGRNYTACCPFHQEKTPSFSVSPDKQFYYCFGCGAGGNAIGFVMDHDHLDFPAAVETLARRAGVEVPREQGIRPMQPRQPAQSPLYGILQAASDFYGNALSQHPARQNAVQYLSRRGISKDIARDFLLGYAPPGWDATACRKNTCSKPACWQRTRTPDAATIASATASSFPSATAADGSSALAAGCWATTSPSI